MNILNISCNTEAPSQEKTKPLRIAFSRCSGNEKYQLYVDMIHHVDSTAQCFDLFEIQRDSAIKLLSSCDGLVLTGGSDVHPSYFNREDGIERCKIDKKRDTLEFEMIKLASEMKMPIFGICRGLQILNVAFGGSLVIDIPDDIGNKVIHRCEEDSCFHEISINKESLLYKLTGKHSGKVNSFHHQAIDRLANDFKISAYTSDSIPEAIEWKNPVDKPFMIAVQWHPERLDFNDPFTLPLVILFLEKALVFSRNNKQSGM